MEHLGKNTGFQPMGIFHALLAGHPLPWREPLHIDGGSLQAPTSPGNRLGRFVASPDSRTTRRQAENLCSANLLLSLGSFLSRKWPPRAQEMVSSPCHCGSMVSWPGPESSPVFNPLPTSASSLWMLWVTNSHPIMFCQEIPFCLSGSQFSSCHQECSLI